MTKYVYAECPVDYWPEIKTIFADSRDDAIEKLIEKYTNEFEDDDIARLTDYESLREYLNDVRSIALSDLYDYETL